ncbi:MAG TPA: EamA family transporter [Acidobacteriaceae bacterium]|nr:EamA family transporter [Acidobacteriaceae bacterium]
MMSSAVSPGLNFIGLGLAASAFWGASDFLGGLATRKANVVLVVALAHGLSLALLLLAALATHSPFPAGHFIERGLSAGTFGGVALIFYYQALSLGEMGLTTALTGLLTALVPVVYGFLTQGSPKFSQIMGFVLAGAAITLIAYAPSGKPRPLALGLAALAGLSFGVFLIVLKLDSTRGLIWPLVFSRIASTTVAGSVVLWMVSREGDANTLRKHRGNDHFLRLAGSAGVLEAIGSLLYMYCSTEGRLDVAAVLTSLYPVVTIVLAAWFLKERTTSSQALGMALALGAVVLVSL